MLNMFVLVAAAIVAQQGQAFRVTIPDEPGIQAVEIQWQGKRVVSVDTGAEWVAVVGVDLETKAGNYTGDLRITKNGAVERRPVAVTVRSVKFPTEQLKVADQYVQLSKENQDRANAEAAEITAIHNTITPEVFWSEPFVSPIPGVLGSNFGKRRVFNGESRNPHNGADLRATTGTPIRATNRGRIVLARDLFYTGNTVIVDHGMGIYTLYAHLSKIDVAKGDLVERSQVVGLAGATGRVTGPHLHWGARVQNARVDPFSLVNLGK